MVLVMKEGTIVEQGSPFELLEADGDFARIWKDDLTLETTQKVDTTNVKGPPITDQLRQRSASNSKRHVKDRSESSFRPDAPEFVPHFQRSTESSSGQKTHPHLGPGHQHDQRTPGSHARSHTEGAGKSSRSPTKVMRYRPYKKNQTSAGKSETSTETLPGNSHNTISTSQLDGSTGPKSIDGKTATRLSRWQRRHQAKSDPSSSAMSSDQAEPTNNKAVAIPSRHVSGPGKYPSEPARPRQLEGNGKEPHKGNSRQNRRRRNQQSRLRKSEVSASEDLVETAKAPAAALHGGPLGCAPGNSRSSPKDKENAVLSKDQIHASVLSGSPANKVPLTPGI